MFERNIETELRKWKNWIGRKVLMVRGARQVGKTSVVRKFGQENFDQVVEINLEKKDLLKAFAGVESIVDFEKRVQLLMGKRLIDVETLLFIDEIQESKEILELLRFFAEERPALHVIVAGSLLEAKMSGSWNIPVGRVDYMYMYPMTFFEYLQAKGDRASYEYLRQIRLGDEIKSLAILQKKYQEYVTIGGMPEVVSNFVRSGDYGETQLICAKLQTACAEDVEKYATGSEKKYLGLVMEAAPLIAGTLYKYENFGGSMYKSREMADALKKLEQVMLLRQIKAINFTNLPLQYKEKRAKKMICLDTGLVNFASQNYTNLLKGEYKGRIMEQVVGQTLLAKGLRQKTELAYWSRDRAEGSAEVDFAWSWNNKIIGLEVKPGNTREMKSLFSMIDRGGKQILPLRVSWDNLGMEKYTHSGKKYEIMSVPFYLLERWEDLT